MDQLAKHTESIQVKVIGLVAKAKKIAKGPTAQHISANIQAKLPGLEDVLGNFNQIAKEQLHCTGELALSLC